MTLLDAPQFDAARARRNTRMIQAGAGLLLVLLVAYWLVASRPVDWPWNWHRYYFGRAAVNKFFTTLEANDLQGAYGIWVHDKNWQQHPQQYSTYPFARFIGDWSPTSPDNEYGPIRSYKIVEAGRYGNGVLIAVLINGHKTNDLDLAYDPKTGQLDYPPPDVKLQLEP
jgi:hypothetical protein